MKESRRRRLKFFFPLVSLFVFVAFLNSCYDMVDIFLLLVFWSSLFFVSFLIVLFPDKFKTIEN